MENKIDNKKIQEEIINGLIKFLDTQNKQKENAQK